MASKPLKAAHKRGGLFVGYLCSPSLTFKRSAPPRLRLQMGLN